MTKPRGQLLKIRCGACCRIFEAKRCDARCCSDGCRKAWSRGMLKSSGKDCYDLDHKYLRRAARG